ncbi:MAG: hypothetical protein ACI9UJ_002287, partial [bacterium]
MVKVIVAILLCLFGFTGFAQEWEQLESVSSDENLAWAEALEQYRQHPIDLNKCGITTLLDLPFIDEQMATHIVNHRDMHGPFIHTLELQQCNLSSQTIKKLLPYVVISSSEHNISIAEYKHTLVFTMLRQSPPKKGFEKPKVYHGNALNTIVRYRGEITQQISASFTGEKDAGEAYFPNRNFIPFDFNSGYVKGHGIGPFSQLVLGDYTCDFGQGLTVGSGMRVGKSANVVQTTKTSLGIKPYRSITEFDFLRGIAASVGHQKQQLSFWLHRNAVDARITNVNGIKQISSIQKTGFHRTASESKNKRQVIMKQVGLNYAHEFGRVKLEYTAIAQSFDGEFLKSTSTYQRFKPTQSAFIKQGIAYRLALTNGYLFGETTFGSNKVVATVFGVVNSLGRDLSFTGLFRKIPKDFITEGSKPFTESSTGNNETGMYLGMDYKLNYKTHLAIYTDRYWFPWLHSQTNTASHGVDYLIRLNRKISKSLSWHIQIKNEMRQLHSEFNQPIKLLMNTKTLKSRCHLVYKVTKQLRLQTRLAITQYKTLYQSFSGTLIYQDIRYKGLGSPFSTSVRFISARIDDFAARIYTYENDIAYRFSLPFYADSRLRTYVLVKYH